MTIFETLQLKPEIQLYEKCSFEDLWPLKEHFSLKEKMDNLGKLPWYKYNIYAELVNDTTMKVWNQIHPYEDNVTEHIATKGTKVLVWMISRFGDVGVTDNLINANGYDVRGLDPEVDLINWQFIRK